MSDSHTEPHVSGQELRAALAQKAHSRPNPLMAAPEPPAWEWTTDEQAELEDLRSSAAELETQVERLRSDLTDSRARENELRNALRRLAEVRSWQRRATVAELSGRGLL